MHQLVAVGRAAQEVVARGGEVQRRSLDTGALGQAGCHSVALEVARVVVVVVEPGGGRGRARGRGGVVGEHRAPPRERHHHLGGVLVGLLLAEGAHQRRGHHPVAVQPRPAVAGGRAARVEGLEVHAGRARHDLLARGAAHVGHRGPGEERQVVHLRREVGQVLAGLGVPRRDASAPP